MKNLKDMSKTRRQTKFSQIKPSERLPKWIKPSIGKASQLEKVQTLVKEQRLHTICEEGRCPNRGECYASGTATFLLGGSICTRSCSFCQVNKGVPNQLRDPDEALRVANAVKILNLNYVVLTSVARDDLNDHGASLFTDTIHAIRKLIPHIDIEVLTPDFWGGAKSQEENTNLQIKRLKTVLSSKPVCFNHNLETVERLQKDVRRGATYSHSLSLLKLAKEFSPDIPTKSGIMLGLGENYSEILQTLKDLREINCQQITMGQYLRPSLAHMPVQKYWHPNEFKELAKVAKDLGFKKISSGPLIHSSYHAASN